MRGLPPAQCARLAIVLLAFGLLLLGVVAPARAAAPAGPASAPRPDIVPVPTQLLANISWNGIATANATTPSKAIAVDFSQTIAMRFSWTLLRGTAGGTVSPITAARLELVYLGQAVYTKDEVSSAPLPPSLGSINMSVDLSTDRYLIAGIYAMNASLLGQNGTTDFSEIFYVSASPPLHLVASTVGLGGLLLYELYATVTVGPHAATAAASASARFRRS